MGIGQSDLLANDAPYSNAIVSAIPENLQHSNEMFHAAHPFVPLLRTLRSATLPS
jgi:hypothetical protein